MPAVTRSQTRALLNHLKTAPYPVDFLTSVKTKYPQKCEKIEELINDKNTPPAETVIDAVIDIAQSYMHEYNRVEEENSQIRELHILGDILYKCLTPVRKHIYAKTRQNTSAFITSWEGFDIDNDTTKEAKILDEFIREGAGKKPRDPSYFQTRFQRYKTWLRMYAERCELVHSGFEDMEPQRIWETLRDIETEVNSGAVAFENPDWKAYALEAIADMRICKFNWKNGRWEDKDGKPINI